MLAVSKLIPVLSIVLLAGCVTPAQPPQPYAVPNEVRSEIGRLAVRAPSHPKVVLTEQIDNRGEAAGRTAKSASAEWLGASLDAAGSSENAFGGLFMVAFGLVTTPIVAAGGAAYGAAAADSEQTIQESNQYLADAFGFTPLSFQRSLESALKDAPLEITFVESTVSDQQLAEKGFDTVLDMRMNSIATEPSANQFEVSLSLHNTMILTRLSDSSVLARRDYRDTTESHKLSHWANNDGAAIITQLDAEFTELSTDIGDEFFYRSAIRVAGMEPVSRRGYGKINATVPMFVWQSWDGSRDASSELSYELQLFQKGKEPTDTVKTDGTRFVPSEPLQTCTRYHWRVRAHYQHFGQPVLSDWSPDYRFRTSCTRNQRSRT